MTDAREAVAAYWAAAQARDWAAFGALVADDIVYEASRAAPTPACASSSWTRRA